MLPLPTGESVGAEEQKGGGEVEQQPPDAPPAVATAEEASQEQPPPTASSWQADMAPAVMICEEALAMTPVPGAPFFFVSMIGRSFDDLWQPFLGGLLSLPQPVYYRAFYQAGETKLAVEGHSSFGEPHLPPAVQEQLVAEGVTAYDYAWVVSDVSSLIGECGLTLNLSHHAWYFQDDLFPEVMGGRRVEVPVRMGAFTFVGGSGVAPFQPDRVCLPFQTLDTLPMTIHPQKGKGRAFGGLCCSPNNARFTLLPEGSPPISVLWTMGVCGQEGEGRRAMVTLQWILHGHVEGIDGLRACRTLSEVLHRVQDLLGPDTPCVRAVCGMFGMGPLDGLVPETPPLHRSVARKEGGEDGEGRGRGRGRGRGEGGRGRGRDGGWVGKEGDRGAAVEGERGGGSGRGRRGSGMDEEARGGGARRDEEEARPLGRPPSSDGRSRGGGSSRW